MKREMFIFTATGMAAFLIVLQFHYYRNLKVFKKAEEWKITTSGFAFQDELIRKLLKEVHGPINDTEFGYIFKGNSGDQSTWEFNFSDLTKRKLGRSYVEMTSFRPNAVNGDFYNPIRFDKGGLVLFEDYGAGVFHRLALLHTHQALNQSEKVDEVSFESTSNLSFHTKTVGNVYLSLSSVRAEVDGEELITVPTAWKRNFAYPFPKTFFRFDDKKNKAGFQLTHPISYAKSFRIITRWPGSEQFKTDDVWNQSKVCHDTKTACNVKVYFGVTVNKLEHGAKINTHFKDYVTQDIHSLKRKYLHKMTSILSIMASEPEKYAPGIGSSCSMVCHIVKQNDKVVLFESSSNEAAKVIQSMRVRVYDLFKGQAIISENWRRVLISMQWDGKKPQVKDIPLGGIFNVGLDFIREIKSLTTGLRKMSCDLTGDAALKLKPFDWTAYLFYEMPFWKSAKITVSIPNGFKSALICSQFSTKLLDYKIYHPRLTGYFSAQLTQQGFDLKHNKDIFHLQNEWGHVVAVNFFWRSKKISQAQELDINIETNNATAPIFPGTGLEDFFHYFHDFFRTKNITGPFNGIPSFYKTKKMRMTKCFRQNTLDPILFINGIRIYLESHFNQKPNNYRKFLMTSSSFNQNILPDSLYTVVLYYGSKGSGGLYTDKVNYYSFENGLSPRLKFIPARVKYFNIQSMYENQAGGLSNKTVVSLEPGQTVVHTFFISESNVGVVLRREYHSIIPNQKANVVVDEKEAGIWFCPQRAITELYSLRLNDYLLPLHQTIGKRSIEVKITAITKWETVSIHVLSVLIGSK
ncbi:uncharacterized protein LOC124457498 isoform X2 [Xenia sp. Carnegie-2017]|uniref:uncharacterized protein LOC124457498 isoform X2 n=1 Tax=Xenia sp. Carnegie-2017 TaxID=2897299 RepID=UPI001F04C9E3|nr:uncharacterized protein LOC124457498 isoform X2 [Xenia sp. Carnegie-2017]